MAVATRGEARPEPLTERNGRETAELTLRLLEYLAVEPQPRGVTELALAFGTSKATIHRHLRVLTAREFVRQDPSTQRYEAGIKLFRLGESLRERFGILPAARNDMVRLRDETGQAVTLSALIEERVVILDLVPGLMVVEFGIRLGTHFDPFASAHGRVALAFGPASFLERCLAELPADSERGKPARRQQFKRQIDAVRKQGWATAANEVVVGLNAIAAPIIDNRGKYAGSIAIAGSTNFIAPKPDPRQIAQVAGAAIRISRQLGWRGA